MNRRNGKLNEATLEQRIGSILKTVFPTFKELGIKHQENFTIKLGHHNVTVDLKSPSNYPARAIYDILLTTKDGKTNLILLELKSEGKPITQDDIDQGISYARLIHPMPPICLISNGEDSNFYDTYLKQPIITQTVDFSFIHKRIQNSFTLALNDFKDAVNTLLNGDPQIITQVINDISSERFEILKGDITDFTKPICDSFIIDREYTLTLKEKCGKKKLIGIIGHAFSGKTNILYDFFKTYNNSRNAIYYLDCREVNYSIFQHLSNHFTKQCDFSITPDKIREWIIFSMSESDNISFIFLIDNLSSRIPHKIKEEIYELIDLFDGSRHTIIFTIDLVSYEELAKHEFRNYRTILGAQTHTIYVSELNQEEFENCFEKLYDVGKALFEVGSHFAVEFRYPRVLRLLASYFANDAKNLAYGQGYKILAVPDLDLLELLANNRSFSSNLKERYVKLTKAFLLDRSRRQDYRLNLASRFGGISLSSIKQVFENESKDLLESDIVVKHEFKSGLSVVYPKIPELISYNGIQYIADLLLRSGTDNIDKVYHKFHRLCSHFVHDDIVGAGVLLKIAYSGNIDLFSNLIRHLMSLPPFKERIKDGTKVAMLIDERINVEMEFKGDSFEEGFTSNYFPYLVLAQLAGYPLRVESPEHDEYDFHLQLLLDLAKCPYAMVRVPNFTWKNLPPILSFQFKTIGTIISGKNGIIEPLVQSIQKCFYSIPEQIEKLYEFAFDQKLFPVIWRIYLAIRNETNSVDEKIAQKANEFMERFEKEFPDLFDRILKEEE